MLKSTNLLLDNQIERITEGLRNEYRRKIRSITNQSNVDLVCKFISALKTEANISDKYRVTYICLLCWFSRFHDDKAFKSMTRDDILAYLDHLRNNEVNDPQHKWIGTYNLHLIMLIRFFRWVYYPEIEQAARPKPPCVLNIRQLRRKEKSIYKPTDLWTQEDDLLFLKYCSSKRDRCYHAISRDTSSRPHEIVKIHIKDIVFKMLSDRQYAEVLVNGKTGSRHIPLINSIPYLKDWLEEHPVRGNPNAPLICGVSKSVGRALSSFTMNVIYRNYRTKFFPRLLENPSVSPEDKVKIRELLKKPWNPYIRRHSALTDKSKILKEHVLRQHAGWSGGSEMPQKYLHYFGNESSESLLEAYGLKPRAEEIDKMKPKNCPNCSEPNKPDSKFCAKCRMVLSYDAYTETVEEKNQKESRIESLENQIQSLMASNKEILECLKHPDKIIQISQEE